MTNVEKLKVEKRGGKTTLVNTTLYKSRAARDGALESGMSDGRKAGYARIDELPATLHG